MALAASLGCASSALAQQADATHADRLADLERRIAGVAQVDAMGVLRLATAYGAGTAALSVGALGPRPTRGYRYSVAAASLSRAVLHMMLTARDPDPIDTSALPPDRAVRATERSLEELASTARRVRVAWGSLQLLSGLLYVPLYLAPSGWQMTSWRHGLTAATAGLSLTLAFVELLGRSAAERHWGEYRAAWR